MVRKNFINDRKLSPSSIILTNRVKLLLIIINELMRENRFRMIIYCWLRQLVWNRIIWLKVPFIKMWRQNLLNGRNKINLKIHKRNKLNKIRWNFHPLKKWQNVSRNLLIVKFMDHNFLHTLIVVVADYQIIQYQNYQNKNPYKFIKTEILNPHHLNNTHSKTNFKIFNLQQL